MEIKETKVTLRKLVADEDKILISKTLNEFGNPSVIAKEVYLGNGGSESDFEEVIETELVLKEETEVNK